jgi:hypothetical protein
MNLSSTLRTIGNALEVKRMMRGMRSIEPNDLLHRVGLERQRSTMEVVLPAVGFLVAGAALGAGLAILFTPSTGAQVRGKIAKAATDAKDKVEGLLGAGEEDSEEEDAPVSRAHNGRRAHNTPAA